MSKEPDTADHVPGTERIQVFTHESFLKEFETIRPGLQSYLFRITANTEDTEDLLQETWIKASRNLAGFRHASSLKTWIFAIATNLARDHLRSKTKWPVNAMDLAREASMRHPGIHIARFIEINSSSPHGAFDLREHINFCFTCIGKMLPIEQQVALLLKELFDFKVDEIAVILDSTKGVVKHLLLHARKTMLDIFEQRCSLINKNGVCHQCSEPNGLFNPKQNFQEEKIKAGFTDNTNNNCKEQFFILRTNIAKAINPFQCEGSDLQFFHFEHIGQVLDTVNARGE